MEPSPQPERPRIDSGPDNQYRITRSQPDEIVRHDISDEELISLSDLRRGYLWEGMWVALGVFLGVAPTAVSVVADSYTGEEYLPIEIGDLIQIVICSCAILSFLILAYVLKDKTKNARDLLERIRTRTRREVYGSSDDPLAYQKD